MVWRRGTVLVEDRRRLRGRKDASSGRCTCRERGHAVSCPWHWFTKVNTALSHHNCSTEGKQDIVDLPVNTVEGEERQREDDEESSEQ